MSPEILAVLDKLRGTKERSPFLAQLIAARADQEGVLIAKRKVVTNADIVRQAAEQFEQANHRSAAILELQGATKLSYNQVWNAVRSFEIKTLSKAEYETVKRIEGEKRDRELLERAAYPSLVEWNKRRNLSPLTLTKYHGENRSAMRIGKLNIELSRRYNHTEEALPEFTEKVQAIIAKYAFEMFSKAQSESPTTGWARRTSGA